MSNLGQLSRSVAFEVVDNHGEGQENVPFVMITPSDKKVVGHGFSEKGGVEKKTRLFENNNDLAALRTDAKRVP